MRVRTNEAIDLEPTGGADWKAIDSALRTIVQRRGALDALEAKWIREAVRVRIWREVGCVNMADYLERRLGYAPRTGYDRVRVAMALEDLPKLAAALASGLPHSAVRALTRVCTNDNEQRWLDEVRGKSVHEIENMVSGRRRGSDPADPADPSLVGKTLPFEGIRPATEALVRDARRALQEERGTGEVLTDDDVLAAFARMVLEGSSGERTKAPYQIAVGLCERCGCGWQESGGRKFALSKADTERACCDAQWIGRVDDGAPDRATQDVPPSVRRMVHRRAHGRCEIPGCRSTRCLEIHHIVARSLGGTHDPENLILACDGCHAAHHRGLIAIGGTASELIVHRKHELAYDMVANDETSAASIELDPSAHVSTSSSQPLGTEPASEPSAHVSSSSNHSLATAPANDDAGHPTTAHVSTNSSHAFDAAVARSRKRDALARQHMSLESSAHVSTNAGHVIDAAVLRPTNCFAPTSDGQDHEPSAHVSTNAGHAIDAAALGRANCFAPTSDGQDHEPSAHVSTNAGHVIDAAALGPANCFAPTSEGQDHEPSAHVSTNAGHAIDAAAMRPANCFAPTSDGQEREPSAHASTNVGDAIAVAMRPADFAPTSESGEPSAHVSTSGFPSASTPSHFEQERIRAQARIALVTLGYKSGKAGKAVDLAIRNGHDTLETVIRQALRSCIRSS